MKRPGLSDVIRDVLVDVAAGRLEVPEGVFDISGEAEFRLYAHRSGEVVCTQGAGWHEYQAQQYPGEPCEYCGAQL